MDLAVRGLRLSTKDHHPTIYTHIYCTHTHTHTYTRCQRLTNSHPVVSKPIDPCFPPIIDTHPLAILGIKEGCTAGYWTVGGNYALWTEDGRIVMARAIDSILRRE
jgi:hypothetical protein